MKGKLELWDGMTTDDLKLEIAKADGVDIIKAWNEGAEYESPLEDCILDTLSSIRSEDFEGNISDDENCEFLTLNEAVLIVSKWDFYEEED